MLGLTIPATEAKQSLVDGINNLRRRYDEACREQPRDPGKIADLYVARLYLGRAVRQIDNALDVIKGI